MVFASVAASDRTCAHLLLCLFPLNGRSEQSGNECGLSRLMAGHQSSRRSFLQTERGRKKLEKCCISPLNQFLPNYVSCRNFDFSPTYSGKAATARCCQFSPPPGGVEGREKAVPLLPSHLLPSVSLGPPPRCGPGRRT